jgi:hypothetical protein
LKCFTKEDELILIDEEISEDEILVRFIFDDHFKRKLIQEDKIITNQLFGPYKGGASLQRERYCDESSCLELGNKIANKRLVGFLLFKRLDLDKEVEKFISSTENKSDNDGVILDAYLKATPLDESFNYLDFSNQTITTKTLGNPSHADLVYVKPKLIENTDEFYSKPNIIIRLFSKKMSLQSKIVLDENLDSTEEYTGTKFQSYFSS